MKTNLTEIYIAGTALCLLFFVLMMHFVYAYNRAKRKLKNGALLLVDLFEKEMNHLNELMRLEQQKSSALTDYYLVRMAEIIKFAEKNQFIDLNDYPEWDNHVEDMYELLYANLAQAKRNIKSNNLREAQLNTKINIIKTQTRLTKQS
jgi:hypothetical protein